MNPDWLEDFMKGASGYYDSGLDTDGDSGDVEVKEEVMRSLMDAIEDARECMTTEELDREMGRIKEKTKPSQSHRIIKETAGVFKSEVNKRLDELIMKEKKVDANTGLMIELFKSILDEVEGVFAAHE